MPDQAYLNARAELCSSTTAGPGWLMVRYAGGDYLMVGLYLARTDDGRRELFYILRQASRDGESAPRALGWEGRGG